MSLVLEHVRVRLRPMFACASAREVDVFYCSLHCAIDGIVAGLPATAPFF